MRYLLPLLCLFVLAACRSDTAATATEVPETENVTPRYRFADEIEAFEARDAEAMPKLGGVVLVGSSSIRLWNNAEQDLAPLPVVRRGFGGARIDDVLYYTDRIVLPYAPSMILFFAGTNDLAGNEDDLAPEVIRDRYRAFTERVHAQLPDTDIFHISITPSKAREAQLPQVKATNDLIEAYSAGNPRLHFFDLEDAFLNADGTVNGEYFVEDGLHLNRKGYRVWKDAMQSTLMRTYMKKPKVQ